jgi:hypothetical protein
MRLVCKVLWIASPPRTHYRIGFPPGVISNENHRELMEAADVLLIEDSKDGILRFTASGKPIGDTWHANLEECSPSYLVGAFEKSIAKGSKL